MAHRILSCCKTFFFSLLVLILSCACAPVDLASSEDQLVEAGSPAQAVEISSDGSTDKWIPILEGQSVPQGVHVRMDLGTGKKEFKLLDPAELQAAAAAEPVPGAPKASPGLHLAALSPPAPGASTPPAGAGAGARKLTGEEHASGQYDLGEIPAALRAYVASLDDGPAEAKTPLEAMLGALRKLPEAEQVRLGVPGLSLDRPADRERVAALWRERQREILEIAERMTNTASLLAGYIEELAGARPEDEGRVLDALFELEDHLADIDMTRDFHTLGGFPVLWRLAAALAGLRGGSGGGACAALVLRRKPLRMKGGPPGARRGGGLNQERGGGRKGCWWGGARSGTATAASAAWCAGKIMDGRGGGSGKDAHSWKACGVLDGERLGGGGGVDGNAHTYGY